jgi:hypothetical protein
MSLFPVKESDQESAATIRKSFPSAEIAEK